MYFDVLPNCIILNDTEIKNWNGRCIKKDLTKLIGAFLMGHLTMELYLRNLSTRYRQSNKKDKGIMLDEYCSTSGHSRKHAIKSIGNAWRQKMESYCYEKLHS